MFKAFRLKMHAYWSVTGTHCCSTIRRLPHSRRPLAVAAMRAVIQRVTTASVEVEGKIVSKIGRGWLCLIGLTDDDTAADAEYISKKILRTRGWHDPDTGSPWAKDVAGIDGQILLVSQFTLYGRLKKPKPDYSKAMGPNQARAAYQAFVDRMKAAYMPNRVQDGVFGAMMNVVLENDGPVTFIIDSQDK
eukprot:GHRR01030204.1.p1 GENE.GHRR01030204.1~~GHRR01030204.1.p1  ORF type:complete len:190 (+),score=33.15 GHRR01030204.1:558-1127(+)